MGPRCNRSWRSNCPGQATVLVGSHFMKYCNHVRRVTGKLRSSQCEILEYDLRLFLPGAVTQASGCPVDNAATSCSRAQRVRCSGCKWLELCQYYPPNSEAGGCLFRTGLRNRHTKVSGMAEAIKLFPQQRSRGFSMCFYAICNCFLGLD